MQPSPTEAVAARKAEVAGLKAQLEEAPDPAARRAILTAYRAKIEQQRAVRQSQLPALEKSTQSPEAQLAELKARLHDNPAAQARVGEMEQRRQEVTRMKDQMAQIAAAEGEEKQELLEEFRSERTRLAKQRQEQVQAQLQRMAPAKTTELPPEIQAIKAKAEARKQEIEDLKAALEQAQPTERVALIDAYRQKKEAARAERMQQIESQRLQPENRP